MLIIVSYYYFSEGKKGLPYAYLFAAVVYFVVAANLYRKKPWAADTNSEKPLAADTEKPLAADTNIEKLFVNGVPSVDEQQIKE